MKRVVCSILTFVLLLSLFVPASYAAKWDYDEIPAQVERTNNEIERLVQEAIEEAEKIDESSKHADKELNKIIDKLVKTTDKIAEKMMKEAAKLGIEVLCEYVPYVIGDQIVLIDPLIVVSF